MLPLRDLNPTRRFPILTFLLIAINVIVFLWQLSLNERQLFDIYRQYAAVPAELSANPFSLEALLDSIRSMFLHGGWAHLLGNMLYLYLFGDNIEDRFGYVLYLVLYFVSGFVAVAAQVLIEPTSPIPMIGASGAIAGVLGSYLVLFPRVKVRGIVPIGFFGFFAELPAFIVLGFWFVIQLFTGITSLGAPFQGDDAGIAFFAHIGGFVAGVVITLILNTIVPQPPVQQREQMLYERAKRYRF
jgi:membrane associated rhomboid family serine protease